MAGAVPIRRAVAVRPAWSTVTVIAAVAGLTVVTTPGMTCGAVTVIVAAAGLAVAAAV